MSIPALPGLFTQGDSREEALKAAREAIEFYLECLAAEGEGIPEEGSVVVEQIDVAVA